MELALVVSIISICGFAGALSYNVYEFRKVGKAIDRINERLEAGSKEHERIMKRFDQESKEHERIMKRFELGRKEHERMIKTLDKINENLAGLIRSTRRRGIRK